MELPSPAGPAERGEQDGLAYWLWKPASGAPPWPAMVILHGAGSGKENHADFARACAAQGWLAVSYDQRGHGASAEPMGPAALSDVGRIARWIAERPDVDAQRVCVRGSSMGGWFAIQAAATSDAVAGVIAICPASEDGLRRGLRNGELEMRADSDAFDAWLGEHDLRDAIAEAAGKPVILLHAKGDERVPYTWSEQLYARAGEPRKLVVLPGGHHRSIQHDAELWGVALTWLQRALGR